MSINASAVRFPIDAENIIRAENAGAITAAEASAGKELGKLGAYWNEGEVAMPLQLAIVLFVTDLATAGGDEEYQVAVEVGSAAEFSDAAAVITTNVTKTGLRALVVTREDVLSALPTASHIRVKVTPSGVAPSIDYWAQLSPTVGR